MINFYPYIGSPYKNGSNSVKTLFLGLSHYGEESDDHPEFTKGVIDENAYNPGNPFFTEHTKILRLSEAQTIDSRSTPDREITVLISSRRKGMTPRIYPGKWIS